MGSKIYWIKSGSDEMDMERTPPYPSFNAMTELFRRYTSNYLTIAMAEAYWERHEKACKEINDEANKLRCENWVLKRKVKELEGKLSKWENQRGKGRRPSKKLHDRRGEVLNWKAQGVSNCEIARRLNVSEGTIRRMIKANADGLKNALAEPQTEYEAGE